MASILNRPTTVRAVLPRQAPEFWGVEDYIRRNGRTSMLIFVAARLKGIQKGDGQRLGLITVYSTSASLQNGPAIMEMVPKSLYREDGSMDFSAWRMFVQTEMYSWAAVWAVLGLVAIWSEEAPSMRSEKDSDFTDLLFGELFPMACERGLMLERLDGGV